MRAGLIVLVLLCVTAFGVARAEAQSASALVECETYTLTPQQRLAPCTAALAEEGLTTEQRFNVLSARGYIYYFTLEQHDLALADYNAAVLLDPELDPQRRGRASLFFNRGRILTALEQYAAAVADFARAAEINPRWGDPLSWSANVKLNHLRDYTGAVTDIEEAVRRASYDEELAARRCAIRAIANQHVSTIAACGQTPL